MASNQSLMQKYYKSFSGVDALAFLIFPGASPVCIGSMTTISYSIFREKVPVKLMGRVSVSAFTKGLRYVAGTMIFTMINKHWVNELIEQIPWMQTYGSMKADELPPFDIMVVCANEYGASTAMTIYAVEVSEEGQTLSIEDMFTENQFSFIAKDIDTLNSDGTGNIRVGASTTFRQSIESITPISTSMPSDNDLKDMKESKEVKNDELTIWVNGSKVVVPDSELERPKVNEYGKATAPIRFIFDALGWSSRWIDPSENNGVDKSIFSSDETESPEYVLEIDNNNHTAKFNDNTIDLGAPPLVSNGRTVCGIRSLFDMISRYTKSKYTTTWGYGSNSVFINDQEFENKPEINSSSNNVPTSKDEIQSVQALLNDNGIRPLLKISGVYDYTTKWAVTAFQLKVKLPVSGVVNMATWDALLKHKGLVESDEWPKQSKVVNRSGTNIRKDPEIKDNNVITKLLDKQSITICEEGSSGWCPVLVMIHGIEIKGWAEKKDVMI